MHGSLAAMVASLAGARMTDDASFTSVSTDSRTAGPGDQWEAVDPGRVGEVGVEAQLTDPAPAAPLRHA